MTSDWITAKLKDCFKLKSGENLTAKAMIPGDYSVFGGNGIAGTHHKYNLSGDNVIVGRVGALCGNARHITTDIWLTDNAFKVVDKKYDLDNRFLTYLLNFKELRSFARQAAQPVISNSSLAELTLNFPESLEEQKRIVTIIDNSFTDIDKALTTARQNLENASELFVSSLQGLFATQGKNWERVSLGELIERGWITGHLDGNHGGDYPRKNEFVESGVPYISAKCIRDGEVNMDLAKYLTEERAATLRKGIAKNNDVLFAHNATVGPVAILKTDEDKVILGTSLTYYRCNENYILPEYLAQYMITYEFVSQYSSIMRQSTRNQVPITKQREFIHVIPPIEKQHEVALKLAKLSSELNYLKTIYNKKISALDELKASILQKAFSGELTRSKGAAA
ncbi:restriction endonuclease subunit S [Pseudoalteromonas sp. bablab_jr004]|uniref:restriction endonuclease subunit S n=1 Tax=Pseudoalteromonas sp. bablab_jr004 TaxID=2755065 RepID=UPI0018F27C8C|nr:restriction endonuclease subunit S [Pseudoalteromonas sp. bablab_jr004]|tara:strand:- start:383 stop:1567 length:1185 start_codon:yes stop_codon:yes gene_type:complete